jgi:dimethylhistidine N-methyltransferase
MSARHPLGTSAGVADDADTAQFAADVEYYLMLEPRQLPSRYLYDALGSALFDAICRLPWYPVTRAEQRLLRRHGADILRLADPLATIVELGSGSGEKLRTLVEQRSADAEAIDVHLVDISASALAASALALRSVGQVRVRTHRAAYEPGLRAASAQFEPRGRALALLLGSNIGNYDPPGAAAFMRSIHGRLRTGDLLLLGADLVKPERDLLLAYDDPLAVTAAFNRNLLVRINRELNGDFDLDQFAHRAVWSAGQSRIEMHLVSRREQRVSIPAANVAFAMPAGDFIWTESSYKYRPHDVTRLLEEAGFRVRAQWIDAADQFALTLADAQ